MKRKPANQVLRAASGGELLRCAAEPMEFDLNAAADGKPAPKKFSLVGYTGAAMRPSNWYQSAPLVLDIAGAQIPRQSIPANYMHNAAGPGPLIGHTTKIETSAQRVKMDGLLSAFSETSDADSARAAREVVHLASGGFPFQASMEFSIGRPEFFEAGQKINVNGKSFTGPLYVARSWSLRGISILANGADEDTSATIAASQSEESTMFETWLRAKGFDPATITADQKKFMQGVHDAELRAAQNQPPPPAVVNPPAAGNPPDVTTLRAAAIEESQRIAAIAAICLKAGSPKIKINKEGVETEVDLQTHALQAGWTAEKTQLEAQAIELAILRAGRRAPSPAFVTPGNFSQSETADAITAALCLRAGIKEDTVGEWYDEKTMNAALSKQIRRTSIGSLMHSVIRAAGLHADPGSVNDDTIRAALRAERMLMASAQNDQLRASGFSTLSLSGILSNLANKAMLASYNAQAVLWPSFAAIRSHQDFKVHTRYRLDSTGAFKKVGPNGELKHVGLTDTAYTNQLGTYGALISLTRQMMINDDLGAFTQIPDFLGRMAAVRIEEAFFVLLLSNPSNFFSAGNKNLITGAGGAMSAANGLAAITAAEQKFSDGVDSNGKPILLAPDRILTGTANYIPARNIYEGRVKITGANQTEVANNEHAGKYQPYRSTYVNNTAVLDQDGNAISGQSSTLWWLFADPAVRAAFAVAFLDSNRVPTIQSEDAEFETLGMQWRAFHDFGVGTEDPKAAVQVNGG